MILSVMATISKEPDSRVLPHADVAPDAISRSWHISQAKDRNLIMLTRMTDVSCWNGLAPAPVRGVVSVMAMAFPVTPFTPVMPVMAACDATRGRAERIREDHENCILPEDCLYECECLFQDANE